MKAKKRIFFSIILVIAIISSFQMIASAAETHSGARISYTFCETGIRDFQSSYDTHFNCTEGNTRMVLQNTNNAITAVESFPYNTFREVYVGIRNSSGTWKSDTQSNSNNNRESAEVNPLIFTPVYSQHDIIFYEPTIAEYKMHSRIYQ